MSRSVGSSTVVVITKSLSAANNDEVGSMAKEKVGVVGAGLMGAEIALVFALAGHEVRLSDTGEAQLVAALERLGRTLDRGIQRGFYKDEEKPLALARIATTVALDPFADCDFVTEAVFEDEAVKAETYKKL